MPPTLSHLLTDFLASPQRPGGTMTFYELQGFLFSIACSPVLIKPSEWLPVIFNDQDAGYADMDEASTILEHLMTLYNLINTQVYTDKVGLPGDFPLQESAQDNIGESAALGQWSAGYSIGHNWLQQAWTEYTPDSLDEELGSCMMVLSFFSSRQIAEALHQETTQTGKMSFDDFAESMLDMFHDAMISYASIGRSIYTVLAEQAEDKQPYVRDAKVGRNEPCPCGSGKKYKHCCLH